MGRKSRVAVVAGRTHIAPLSDHRKKTGGYDSADVTGWAKTKTRNVAKVKGRLEVAVVRSPRNSAVAVAGREGIG